MKASVVWHSDTCHGSTKRRPQQRLWLNERRLSSASTISLRLARNRFQDRHNSRHVTTVCFSSLRSSWHVANKCFSRRLFRKLLRKTQVPIGSQANVNGDIAFLWEWWKFDPLQNPNPFIDCDKTSTIVHVTRKQTLCISVLTESLGKYVKYKAFFPPPKWPTLCRVGALNSTHSLTYFFHGLAYWSDPCLDFDAQWLKTRGITQGSGRWPTTFSGYIPPNRQILASIWRLTSMKNDIIEEWRQWRLSFALL